MKSNFIDLIQDFDCSIIDNYENNIDEKLMYSIINQSKQLEKNILITSKKPLKNSEVKLKIYNQDLKFY